MKTSKYLEELKTQSVADLNAQLVDAKKELFNLRFQNATTVSYTHLDVYKRQPLCCRVLCKQRTNNEENQTKSTG